MKHASADAGAYEESIYENFSTPLMPGSATRSAFTVHELLGHVESKSLTIGLNTLEPYKFVIE